MRCPHTDSQEGGYTEEALTAAVATQPSRTRRTQEAMELQRHARDQGDHVQPPMVLRAVDSEDVPLLTTAAQAIGSHAPPTVGSADATPPAYLADNKYARPR